MFEELPRPQEVEKVHGRCWTDTARAPFLNGINVNNAVAGGCWGVSDVTCLAPHNHRYTSTRQKRAEMKVASDRAMAATWLQLIESGRK